MDDREVDLHLVQPGGVDGGVHHDRVRELGGEPVAGGLAAVGGAVVHDPEHAFGRGVGLGGHHLGDECGEGVDACGVLAAAEDLGVVDVVGGEVGQCPAAVVVVVDAHHP